MIENGQKYLVTSDEWFVSPNGFQCKSAWGKCIVKTIEEVFNITPLRPSTNWFLQIGEGDKSIVIAGCHIHYAIRCENRPIETTQTFLDKETNVIQPVNKIYFTE